MLYLYLETLYSIICSWQHSLNFQFIFFGYLRQKFMVWFYPYAYVVIMKPLLQFPLAEKYNVALQSVIRFPWWHEYFNYDASLLIQ